MDLATYDHKYVQVKDDWGNVFTGVAGYHGADYCFHEYGTDEPGVIIGDCLVFASQVVSIEEVEPHGTAEIWTEHLVLRKHVPDDADALYEYLGTDPDAHAYTGWNPYATREMARETVRGFIDGYRDGHFYAWAMDVDGVLVGTIGAYDYADGTIEVGFSVVKGWRGRGFASEALEAVLAHLTAHEGIACVTAWCAAENAASWHALEKAGMRRVRVEEDALEVDGNVYDKFWYEYRA